MSISPLFAPLFLSFLLSVLWQTPGNHRLASHVEAAGSAAGYENSNRVCSAVNPDGSSWSRIKSQGELSIPLLQPTTG